MNRSRSPLLRALPLGLAFLTTACGGSVASTLPAAERSLLELAPADAYFVARVDVARVRREPGWERVEARIRREDPDFLPIANGIDHLYLAVGGLVDAPEPGVATQEGDPPVDRPVWQDAAQALGGRIPQAVAIFDGDAAQSLCGTMMLVGEPHEARGYRWIANRGVAFAMREGQCLVTFEPVLQSLLARGPAPLAPAMARLAGVGHGGDLGLGSAVFELDATSFESTIEALGPSNVDDVDGQKWARALRRAFAILTRGIVAVDWTARTADGGYRTEMRLHADDAGRATMWRELTAMYLEIVRGLVEADVFSAETNDSLRAMFEGLRIETTDDGYLVAHAISAQSVAQGLQELVPDEVENADGVTTFAEDVRVPLTDYLGIGPAERIANIEPRLAELADAAPELRWDVRMGMSSAYSSVGRFDDARAQLALASSEAADGVGSSEWPAQVAAASCELERLTGHAERAVGISEPAIATCRSTYCGDATARLVACAMRARADNGDVAGALEAIDPGEDWGASPEPAGALAATRIELLLRAGRVAEALGAAHALCVGPNASGGCGSIALLEIEAIGQSSLPLEAKLRRIEAATSRMYASAETDASALGASMQRVVCAVRGAAAPRDAETREACESAVATSVELHGEGHPDTIAARLAYARVLTAARDRDGVAAQLGAADTALATIGATSPLHRERASLGGARRPR